METHDFDARRKHGHRPGRSGSADHQQLFPRRDNPMHLSSLLPSTTTWKAGRYEYPAQQNTVYSNHATSTRAASHVSEVTHHTSPLQYPSSLLRSSRYILTPMAMALPADPAPSLKFVALGGIWLDEICAPGKEPVVDVPGGSVAFGKNASSHTDETC